MTSLETNIPLVILASRLIRKRMEARQSEVIERGYGMVAIGSWQGDTFQIIFKKDK
jgi:hypothetical protein